MIHLIFSNKDFQSVKGCEVIYSQDLLNVEFLKSKKPKYIFFPFWSWRIPREVYTKFECILFHMTDLPFGRGGSPLQNLLIRGIYETKISAIRVVKKLDAGPVYLKESFNIEHGSAREIYARASLVMASMIEKIIKHRPEPKPQKGKIVNFKRRIPADSCMPYDLYPRQAYDFIRMLDCEGYPKAFLNCGDYILKFSNAKLRWNTVMAEAEIRWLY